MYLVSVQVTFLGRYILRLMCKNKMATSLALISTLSFQPTISFAKEDPISNFFTKMFSSKSSTMEQSTKK